MKLISLGRSSYVSHSGISKLLAHVSEHGLPETYDTSAQFRARKDICRKQQSEYGPLVVDVPVKLSDGSEQQFPFQSPLAWFVYQCKHSKDYARIVSMALDRKPCSAASPWTLVLYQDGIDPSDGLAKNHSRKSAVFYWSFAEYGMHALAHEECWGTLCVARHSEHQKFAGGINMLFEKVLELFFGERYDISRSGVAVDLPDKGHRVILAKAEVLLGDMPALKECVACKGHSGMFCCMLCLNAAQHNSQSIPVHLLTKKAVSISVPDLKKFTLHTDDSIRNVVRRVEKHHESWLAGEITKDAFEDLCIVNGWNWTPANVVLNRRFNLNVASMVMYDWAHIYVHDGLLDNEVGACMKIFHSNRQPTSYTELGEYVSKFTFPKSAPDVSHLFKDSANRNNAAKGSFSCTGSECLTLAPILLRYFQNIVAHRGMFMPFVESLIAVLTVVILLNSVKCGTVSADELGIAILNHLRLYKAAYGDDAFRPKHHYALHLAPMLRHFKFLLATFTQERKHRLVTRYTRDRKNLRSWDSGAIEEVTCHQIWELSQPFFMACSSAPARGKLLIPLKEIYGSDVGDIVVLNGIRCNGGRCSSGDVVSFLFDGRLQLGELLVTVGINTSTCKIVESCIAVWQPIAGSASHDNSWCNYTVSGDNVIKVDTTTSIDTVLTYRMSDDKKKCAVFFPPEIRPR